MPFHRFMGIVPLGIGLTVIGWIWSQPFGSFGAPPLFFRVFISFIALAFILQGAALLFGSFSSNQVFHEWWKKQFQDKMHSLDRSPFDLGDNVPSSPNYTCPNCGVTLANQADVSPHGDSKCLHCGKWWNIHNRTN